MGISVSWLSLWQYIVRLNGMQCRDTEYMLLYQQFLPYGEGCFLKKLRKGLGMEDEGCSFGRRNQYRERGVTGVRQYDL